MKPILFEKDATEFDTLGIARLPDAEKCTVTEERNGAYELELVYPVSGRYFSEIQLDRIIAAVPYDGGSKQAFRIYASETTIDGRVTFYARHISYQLNFIPISAVSGTAVNSFDLFATLKSAAALNVPFSFASNISGSRSYSFAPTSFRSAIGGMEGSLIDLYGGELKWNNWLIQLSQARGSDNGVRITYGKNLTDLRQSVDIGNTITGVMAYWQKQNDDGTTTTVYSSPKVITIDNEYAHERIVTLDVSSDFQEQPSSAQITSYAQSWLNSTSQTDPNAALEINFVPLWQTEEYKQFEPLERVKLCDIVYVSYKQIGVTVKKKVTKTVWNVLLDRYDSIELGSVSTITDTIASMAAEISSDKSSGGGSSSDWTTLFGSYESTDTAQYNHTAGNTFAWKNQYVKCTSAISIGETIAIGTNVSAYSINKAINDNIPDSALSSTSTHPVQNAIITAALGALIESGGTTASGYFRFENGVQVCFGNYSGSSQPTTAVGNFYILSFNPGIKFAKPFIAAPNVIASPQATYSIIAALARNTTGITSIDLCRPNSGNLTPRFMWVAIGWWKS